MQKCCHLKEGREVKILLLLSPSSERVCSNSSVPGLLLLSLYLAWEKPFTPNRLCMCEECFVPTHQSIRNRMPFDSCENVRTSLCASLIRQQWRIYYLHRLGPVNVGIVTSRCSSSLFRVSYSYFRSTTKAEKAVVAVAAAAAAGCMRSMPPPCSHRPLPPGKSYNQPPHGGAQAGIGRRDIVPLIVITRPPGYAPGKIKEAGNSVPYC